MPWLEPLLAGAAVLLADQASKEAVLARPACAAPGLRAFFDLRCIVNRRGTLLPMRRPLRYAAFVLCAASAFFALTQDVFAHSVHGAIGLGFALGGIAGNFLDLVRRDGIVDFLVIGPLPVCNIADWAIAIGLALAVWALV
ncbi:MAG: signal peptidase II [Pseudolabrys sp.]